ALRPKRRGTSALLGGPPLPVTLTRPWKRPYDYRGKTNVGRIKMRLLSRILLPVLLLALTMIQAGAQDASDPTVYAVTYIDVAPASRDADAGFLRQLAAASRKEPGVIRYEAFQRSSPSNQFTIVEIWKDQQSYDTHAASAHVKTFRQQIEPHLIAPIDERPHVALATGPKDNAAIPAGALIAVSHVDVIPPK